MRTHVPFALLATALACSLFAAPAQALRARVFVSKTGADVGTCSFSAPCQSLDFALNAVEASGEITILDSGGYNPITITKGVTITVPPGVEAGIAVPSGGTGITINAPGATVKLRGLTLEGANLAGGGIEFDAGSRIEIIDCLIGDFVQFGINISSSAAASALISNTIVTDVVNGGSGTGIILQALGNATLTAAFNHVTLSGNDIGFNINAPGTGNLEAIVTDSHIDNNAQGITAIGASPTVLASVILKNVTLNDNSQYGISLFTYAVVYLSQVTQTSVQGFTSTSVAFQSTPAGAVSDGTNHLMGAVVGGSIGSWPAN